MPNLKSSWIFLLRPALITVLALVNICFVFAQNPQELQVIRKRLAASEPDNNKADLQLDLGTYFLNKPGEVKSDMDSAMFLKKQALSLSRKLKYHKGIARSLLLEGQLFHESGDNKRSWTSLQKTISYCSSYGLNEQIGEAYQAMSSHFSNHGNDLEKRLFYSQKAYDYFKKTPAKISQARMLETMGDLSQLKGEYDKSVVLLKQSLSVYESVGFKATQGVYNLLGYVYYFKGNNYDALKYLLLALKVADQQGDNSTQLATIYNRLGSVYLILSQPEKAVAAWNKGLEVAAANHDKYAENEIKLRLINVFRKGKKYNQALFMLKSLPNQDPDIVYRTSMAYEFANVYMGLKQYDRTKKYIDILESFTKEFPDEPWTWACYYTISIKYYFQTRQYKAANLATQGDDAIKKISYSISTHAEYQLYWSKIDSALGNDVSALKHYQIYKNLSDSIISNKNSKQLSELQLQYDTEKKDKNIRLLKQQSQLQQTRIHNQEIIRNVIISGLVLLLAFSALMYSRYLLKQQANDKLALKQAEINGQNKILQKLLAEKEWLLKEIHHRVKNNLQIVISLLNSQSAFLENMDALAAIQNSQHRMYAMSLIHQKLYQSGNVASIDMYWYIHELVSYMKECFNTDRKISFMLDINPVELDVSQAVPLGLILNEAITNAIKYAFPDNRKGQITISLKHGIENICELSVADNGIGLVSGFDPQTSESLGMSLMQGLSEQLDGSLSVTNKNGLVLIITFVRKRQIVVG